MRLLQGPDTAPAKVAEMAAALRAGRDCQVVVRNYRKDARPSGTRSPSPPSTTTTGS